MKTLTLPLKSEYFDAIVSGDKVEEYRLVTPYWTKRLVNREYDQITLTKGYPKRDDMSRRHTVPWRGFRVKRINHPHFGSDDVEVFCINVEHV